MSNGKVHSLFGVHATEVLDTRVPSITAGELSVRSDRDKDKLFSACLRLYDAIYYNSK